MALLAHSLDLAVNGAGGSGPLGRSISGAYAREAAVRLLSEPEVVAICESFHHVALADVLDELHKTSNSQPGEPT